MRAQWTSQPQQNILQPMQRVQMALNRQEFTEQEMQTVLAQPTCEDALRLIQENKKAKHKL